ncbi:MAG: hypothetical protein DRJ64_09230 [Thermoprotei archaeon]|nr:MAG: hypothetical protein DRJ64_09230 [Thermoprotei archaeon]
MIIIKKIIDWIKEKRKILLISLVIFFAIFGSIRLYYIYNPPEPYGLSAKSGIMIMKVDDIPCAPIDLFCHIGKFVGLFALKIPEEMKVGVNYWIGYTCIDSSLSYEQPLSSEYPNCQLELRIKKVIEKEATPEYYSFKYSGAVGCSAGGYYQFQTAGDWEINYYVTCPSGNISGHKTFTVVTGSPVCGDGKCENEGCIAYGTPQYCPEDCGPCGSLPFCGDGVCSADENYQNCPNDCQYQPPTCTLTQYDCDDNNPCTYDYVDASCNCQHTPLNGAQPGCSGTVVGTCGDYLTCYEGTCITRTAGCPSGMSCINGECTVGTYCGDGICQAGEDWTNCCVDCGCPSGYVCKGTCIMETVKYPDGSLCGSSQECEGGYCVHGYCRSTPTYCGDAFCDPGEGQGNCPIDCGCPEGTVYVNGQCVKQETLPTIKMCGPDEIDIFGVCIKYWLIMFILVLPIILIVIYKIVPKVIKR